MTARSFPTSMMIILPTLPSLSRAFPLSKSHYLGSESLHIKVSTDPTMERFDIAGRLVSIHWHPFVTFRADIQGVCLSAWVLKLLMLISKQAVAKEGLDSPGREWSSPLVLVQRQSI